MNNFEDKLKKLETLSADIKRTDISLEDALKDFEEGIKLVKGMEKELDEIEAKVQILIKDPDSLQEDKKSKSSVSATVKAENSEATSNAEDASNAAATSNAKTAKSSTKKSAEKLAKQNNFDEALDLFAPESEVNGTRS